VPPQENQKKASKLLISLKTVFQKWRGLSNSGAQTLQADVDEILAGFGKKYKLDFC
jgi:hypothetical protein